MSVFTFCQTIAEDEVGGAKCCVPAAFSEQCSFRERLIGSGQKDVTVAYLAVDANILEVQGLKIGAAASIYHEMWRHLLSPAIPACTLIGEVIAQSKVGHDVASAILIGCTQCE
ncbi:hypothetical protein D3C71_1635580 [compost metagenome]